MFTRRLASPLAQPLLHLLRGNPDELLIVHFGRQAWQRRVADIATRGAFARFLKHASVTVPQYRDAGKILKTYRILRRSDVANRENAFWSSAFEGECRRFFKRTSGTTGTPLSIAFDLAGWYGSNYGHFLDVRRAIPELEGLWSPGKTGVVLVTNKPGRTGFSTLVPPLDYARFTREPIGGTISRNNENRNNVIRGLRQDHIPLLHGKPSYLLELLKMDEQVGRGRITTGAILVSGENLYRDQRLLLEHWFGCRTYNAYALTEGSLVALECRFRRGMHVLGCCHVEVLRDNGQLRPFGAGILVVTSLVNWGMPLIRYDTGDIGTLRRVSCPCGFHGSTLVELDGRECPRFETPWGSCKTSDLDFAAGDLPSAIQITQKAPADFLVRWERRRGIDAPLAIAQALRDRLGPVHCAFEPARNLNAAGGKQRRYFRSPEAE